MARPRILVVDDEKKTVESIRRYLEHGGFDVVVAYNGAQALEEARAAPVDLVILDLMLPRVDGLEVCRRLRESSEVPIIMVTAKTTEADRLAGLELGADDYVTKPFSPRELVARVRTVLRRVPPAARTPDAALRSGALVLDPVRHETTLDGRPIDLTPREFELLRAFMSAPGRAFSRQALGEAAFGAGFDALDRTVDAHIVNLRRKIEADPATPRRIVTVFGVGYRFEDTSDAS
jgi:DNA-binding response OmpR family regulator